MKDLITLLQSYDTTTILVIAILLILAFFGITEMRNKIKEYFDIYYKNRNTTETKDKDVDKRLTNLEDTTKKDEKRLDDISNHISEIKDIITAVQNNQNRANMATAKSAMYRLANELISKTWMSQTEYDTLYELYEVYKTSGGAKHGNATLIERALKLPVLTDEEIQYKKLEEIKIREQREQHENE